MSIVGTVQGALAHLVWYVDWHTGGRTVREAKG
jgi:hypothetical protein